MNAQLLYLAYLVTIKNGINNKRRRFYKIKQAGNEYNYHDSPGKPFVEHKFLTKAFATEMYAKAKEEAKSMTPLIKKVMKEAGARVIWAQGGPYAIGIETSDKCYYFHKYHFNSWPYQDKENGLVSELVEMYHVDNILLKENK
jgi:hypothetical protein